jgi:hypothetical protein
MFCCWIHGWQQAVPPAKPPDPLKRHCWVWGDHRGRHSPWVGLLLEWQKINSGIRTSRVDSHATPPIAWGGHCGAEQLDGDCNHNCNHRAILGAEIVLSTPLDRLQLLVCWSPEPLESAGTNDPAPQRYELAGPLRALRPKGRGAGPSVVRTQVAGGDMGVRWRGV